MHTLSRRRAIKLAASFAATAPILESARSAAQPKPGAAEPKPPAAQPKPGAPPATFEMASFAGPGVDHDTAFAKALAAISESAAAASKAGRAAHIVLDLGKGAIYRITRPLAIKGLNGFELNGNGAQLINTVRGQTLHISGSSNVTVHNLAIDYDPLPFTQGTITAFDRSALHVTVKVDPGYPDDPPFLAAITDGFFKVMDRGTRGLKPGARDFLAPKRIERIGDKLIKVTLQWGANDVFPSQLPIRVGDVVAITGSGEVAIVVEGSAATSFIDMKLFASPAMGILENGGHGGMTLRRVVVVPGPRPKGATTDRLVSTNADGSHFGTVEHGPTIEDCTYANTSDDAVNVHGFYYYVVAKPGPRHYLLSPKWDIGLEAGDMIETCEHGTFRSLGRSKVVQLTKRKAPELKAKIAQVWKGRSPTTQPDLIYDVVLQQDLPLKVADSVTSLSRIGAGTTVRRCSFHACGRVLVKAPNTIVEDCQFTYSCGVALQAGSDIGFWSESGFAENLTLRNNRFTHSVTGANELTSNNAALGAIFVGTVLPEGATGFANNFQNRNVTIAGNRIDDSYTYAIFVSNADGVHITGNVIGQTFIRGNTYGAGDLYRVKPDSGVFIGRARNVQIANNTVARGRVTKVAVAVDRTCDGRTVHVQNNRLT